MSESIQKILLQMQTQLQTQQDDLENANIVTSDLQTRNQMIDVSLREIESTGADSVWESCGKAFLKTESKEYVTKMRKEKSGNADLLKDIGKKKHYLETSINATVDNLNKVFGNSAKK